MTFVQWLCSRSTCARSPCQCTWPSLQATLQVRVPQVVAARQDLLDAQQLDWLVVQPQGWLGDSQPVMWVHQRWGLRRLSVVLAFVLQPREQLRGPDLDHARDPQDAGSCVVQQQQ